MSSSPGSDVDEVTGSPARPRTRLPGRIRTLRDRHAWLDHLLRASARYVAQRGNHFAAAITFFSVLTAVPLLMVAFGAAASSRASSRGRLTCRGGTCGTAVFAHGTLMSPPDRDGTSTHGR